MAFILQLLHFADGEAGLLASNTAPYLAALVDAFDDDYTNTLILAGGDNYIPGPSLAAGTDPSVIAVAGKGDNPGAADIEIHNRIGVEASTIGNHEFDLGTRAFSDAINDAAFPYLSANLDFSGDGDISGRYTETVGVGGLEEAFTLARRVVPSAVVTKGGELIGLVGATTQIIESISSTGGVEVKGFAGDGAEINEMALLAAQLQPVIDDLLNQGVNKIILMSHLQQIALEQELAQHLEGVDIILAAGSNTRLGDANDVAVAFPGHAANFAGSYPIVTNGADGGTTLIVNTDNEFTYLGRLVVEFDAAGNLIAPDLDSIPGDNTSLNGAYAATAANVAAAWGVNEADLLTTAFAEGTKGEQVADITEAVQAVINTKDGEIWGFTDVYLEGERNQVRNQETNLGNLSADAQLEAARDALPEGSIVASLKNGGGIRAQIGSVDVITGDKEPPLANPVAGKPKGAVSSLDIENSLRFNNKLMVFDTTPEGLKAILEHGVATLGNQGRFPQLGGISFSFDPDQPAGSRVLNVAALDANGTPVVRIIENGVVSADAPAKISVATISFLADGGDSYPIKANGENFRYLLDDGTLGAALDETLDLDSSANTPANALGEQRALREFLAEFHGTPNTAFDSADTPGALDQRIQDLNLRSDDVFGPGLTVVGGVGGNSLFGSAGNDVMEGGNGKDELTGLAGDDVLKGGNGKDVLFGGFGNDTLIGGRGADLFVLGAGQGTDIVQDFGHGPDRIGLLAGLSYSDLVIGVSGDDATISFGGEMLAILMGVDAGSLSQSPFTVV
ncbi:MAG: bifunctional metallophosphatase/5'-nucleotidase [Cyanobium sp. CZS 48M]|nr:bifunctional metallophosphatase/5'-nucleotidase [Cyanobium sp. CZS48M]